MIDETCLPTSTMEIIEKLFEDKTPIHLYETNFGFKMKAALGAVKEIWEIIIVLEDGFWARRIDSVGSKKDLGWYQYRFITSFITQTSK